MSRDSQGLYTLPAGNPVVPGTLIESTWANGTMNDIAQALTDSLPRNGSAPMTGPLTLAATAPTLPRHATSKSYVDQFIAYATGMPLGGILAMASGTAPPGFLLCNGAAVSRTTYSALFAAIGTIYGAGDGATTFNVPNLQGQFIRGRDSSRTVGSLQPGSIQSHLHPVTDPGHSHAATQAAHNHAVALNAHSHSITDPGHLHSFLGKMEAVSDGNDKTVSRNSGNSNTNTSVTGISVNAVGDFGGTADSRTPAITVPANTTGLAVAAAGGAETVPQNIALDYYIKAVNDTSAVLPTVQTIETSDANMIAIDLTNPLIPVLDIKSNVALGTVKLDTTGKVPIAQMPTSSQEFLGYFDASPGLLPVGTFTSGSFYAISVGGTLTVYDPVTLTPSATVVAVGGQIHYVSGSISNPTGWYYLTVSGATLASDVQFIPVGGISSTNVQTAIGELDADTTTALSGKAPSSASTAAGTSFTPAGSIGANNVQSAISELDTETQSALSLKANISDLNLRVAKAGDTMTGKLSTPQAQIGTSVTLDNNFTLDATADNGTMKLIRASGQELIKVAANGGVAVRGGTTGGAAGFIGEVLFGAAAGPISLSNGTPGNMTGVTVTPGVWDIQGQAGFIAVTGPCQQRVVSVSLTSAVGEIEGLASHSGLMSVGFNDHLVSPTRRIVATADTLVYLVVAAAFSGGSINVVDGRITARRVA